VYEKSFHLRDVHLWLASLNVTDQVFDALNQGLSSDEWERADRFLFERDRRNFIVGRGILRDILTRYLDCQPGDIRFDYEPHGKPGLRSMGTSPGLEFNLSHSSGFFVLAVAFGRQVGVDIERVRPLPDLDQMASDSFSEHERNALSALTPEDMLLGFFRCWTRKEAYLKARGDGLSIALDAFDMSLAPDNPIHMLSNRLDHNEVSRWSFYTFTPEQGFIGALAIEGQGTTPVFRHWQATDV
jgi:4'-phosphopantetheinyl transferase